MIIRYQKNSQSLRKKSKEIVEITSEIKKTIRLLQTDLTDSGNGVGLSSPQVGKYWRVLVIKHCDHCKIKAYLNPQIIDTFDKQKTYPQLLKEDGSREDFLEGCLSFPGIYGTVRRYLRIKVRYQIINKEGSLETEEEILEDFMAIVFQHELDHLDGILFIDHVKEDKGKLFKEEEKKLNQISLSDF